MDQVERITVTVCRIGKLVGIRPDEDFYDAGFTSVRALELLLELESECGVSIPDDQFIAARTVQDLSAVIGRLMQEQA